MAIIRFLASLTLKGVLPGVCDACGLDAAKAGPEIVFLVFVNRFRDHSQRITEALQESVDRAWSAMELALSGDSWWDRVKGAFTRAEDKAFAANVRAFLDAAPMPELDNKTKFRTSCLEELRAARKQGLLTQAPEGAEPFSRYIDPKTLVGTEMEALENVAGALQGAGYTNLAYLLSLQARQGQSLLLLAVRYFFRRKVEDDDGLFQGLAYAQLDQLQQSQQAGFERLRVVLASQGDRLTSLLVGLEQKLDRTHEAVTQTHEAVTATQDAVLDVQAELARQGAQNKDLYQAVLEMQRKLDLMHREVRPRDSLSIRTDHEKQIVRQVIARYRALPENQRRNMPALLNAVGQLEVAAGEFEAAQQDFVGVAEIVSDDSARGQAHFNAYRAALEQRDWSSALRELVAAIRIDGRRFAPFPVGKYRPKRILGAGGFGVAFLCHHQQLDDDIVVKTLTGDDLERDVDQVFTEARALWKLDHPAIIRLLDCGYTLPDKKARPYFVMHYFDGSGLDDHVKRHGTLGLDDMLDLARQMAQGLQAAHGKGILHRDVKPANVLVRRRDRGWEVKLIDFGLALSQKAIANAATVQQSNTIVSASIAGTLDYAAPEQLGKLPGVRIGPPADVYGLAKTCCFALFESTEPTFQDWQRLPRGWAELLGDCLNKNPDRRPASMAQVLDRLDRLVSGSVPVLAPVVTPVVTPTVTPTVAPMSIVTPIITDDESAAVEAAVSALKVTLRQQMSRGDHTGARTTTARILQFRPHDREALETCELLANPRPLLASLLAGQILDVLRRKKGISGFYISPDVPPKKVANAMKSCGVPPGEKVLGLIDCTVFGSASDALVFGTRAFYYHNMGGNVPDPGCVEYSEFPGINFGLAWVNCVTLGKDRYCNKAGGSITREDLLVLLNGIKDAVVELMEE